MLTEVDLVGLEPLVGIAEAVDGHTHLFQAAGSSQATTFGPTIAVDVVGEHRPHHLLDGIRLESRVVVDEQQQVGIRTYPRQRPVDSAAEAQRSGRPQVTPPTTAEVPLDDSLEVGATPEVRGGVVDDQHIHRTVGLLIQGDEAVLDPLAAAMSHHDREDAGRARLRGGPRCATVLFEWWRPSLDHLSRKIK